ncbi:MAG TPA: ABC transporter permease, partial [Acidobacteriaceae bacterium]|nr:ABC transporter permease [Acidobacteriaceae bacterium]
STADSLLQDLRFAVRQLRKNPGFATTAILVLALGIAASVAIFAFVDAALIRPLPYSDPSRLVILFESNSLGPRFHVSYKDYVDWKNQNTVFSSLDEFAPYGFMLQTPTGTQKVEGARITAGFLRTLGVAPILGRDFRTNDDQPNAPRSVLLSYSEWESRFGGRPDAIGQTVILDNQPNTVIGVMPRDFHFQPAEPADFWTTERADGGCEKYRNCHNAFAIARLRPGVTLSAALANMKTIVAQLERQYPDSNRGRGINIVAASEVIVGDIRTVLLVLLAGAALLLLIATINVASLLLVRSEGRRREIAVRGAIGASRVRLARQFVTEGFVLALSAGLGGTALAAFVMRSFVALIPKAMLATMPYFATMNLNVRVLLFAVLVSFASALLFSIIPVFRIRLADLRDGLTETARGSSGTLWRRLGSNLVVAELAVAVVLLTGAGLLGKSFYRLLHADTGLDPDHLATLRVSADSPAYSKDAAVIALKKEIEARARALPGVRSVAFASRLPLGDGDGTIILNVLGQAHEYGLREVAHREISTAWFSTIQAQLMGGRYFTEDDDASHPLVAIVNQALARKFFPGQDPIGRVVFSEGNPKAHVHIVGVVNDIQEGQLDAPPRAALYIPFYQTPQSDFAVVLRTSQPGDALLSSLAAAVHSIDPGVATFEPSTMDERLRDSPSAWLHRSSAWIVGGFAALALLLSIVGLYGVIAYSVSRRTREIGVRMALGAQRSAVYRLILREAARLAVIGIAAGLLCALAATTLLRSLLFHVQSWDLATLGAVALVLGSAALLASFLPARRAASVNPTEALHAE